MNTEQVNGASSKNLLHPRKGHVEAVRIGLLARASSLVAAPSHPTISDLRFSILRLGSEQVWAKAELKNLDANPLSSGFSAAFVAPTVAGQQRISHPSTTSPANWLGWVQCVGDLFPLHPPAVNKSALTSSYFYRALLSARRKSTGIRIHLSTAF